MGFMDKLNEVVDTAKQAYDESTPGVTKYESTAPAPGQRFEYDVLELREKLLSGAGSAPSQKLRNLVNDRARQGWEFQAAVDRGYRILAERFSDRIVPIEASRRPADIAAIVRHELRDAA